ncbi:MAG: hypothetical protein A3G33_03565 [Omnitrophica bacterium RIFCSPLOWO2_12_FULL_44_17]|uniref:HTH merR-type domain-containing protein n=1 Tax=Candidatus Danuiimicrobium aquiferis TaxID=1801832 RepID=A0A1G1KUC4_9BACT|nr:MAG: hypothetical protein A3B72_07110 [Omnitrophica bacterium RIFCSPHIGHO2_02_FULL_45_28]OGW88722.1 MAG: hypothetical protein A3E74_05205 [Omnitrophica bacterium RIFCSPHIGHO2_12_FULL_44_12]OGW96392.1 MAG: hypothetical protein A3G33_03565 [Omnitrophica bacterium RIFCSPLOWO2_12_FULL_44_17]OGX04802.1 MAG: hypothetical protein A3J12_07565 [Omnitrophica bacterium RIFCSPLOWO2_02_FULL_44_11]
MTQNLQQMLDIVHSGALYYSISSTAKLVGVSSRQLYYWEQLGIVKPIYEQFGSYEYRRFSQSDINVLLRIKQLLNEGYTLCAAALKVKGSKEDSI